MVEIGRIKHDNHIDIWKHKNVLPAPARGENRVEGLSACVERFPPLLIAVRHRIGSPDPRLG
jgi:hypothetical protein